MPWWHLGRVPVFSRSREHQSSISWWIYCKWTILPEKADDIGSIFFELQNNCADGWQAHYLIILSICQCHESSNDIIINRIEFSERLKLGSVICQLCGNGYSSHSMANNVLREYHIIMKNIDVLFSSFRTAALKCNLINFFAKDMSCGSSLGRYPSFVHFLLTWTPRNIIAFCLRRTLIFRVPAIVFRIMPSTQEEI